MKQEVDDWLADVICIDDEDVVQDEVVADARIEIDRYLSEPTPSFTEDPLVWWKLKENSYPTLSILAKKYLCIPASSTPSEKVFSLTSAIVDKKRSRLSSDKVDMLVFLTKNKKCFPMHDLPAMVW